MGVKVAGMNPDVDSTIDTNMPTISLSLAALNEGKSISNLAAWL